jgi:hypothetical protein
MKLENVKPKMLIECDCYDSHYRVRVRRVTSDGIHAETFRGRTNGIWHTTTVNGGLFLAGELSNIRRAKVKRL